MDPQVINSLIAEYKAYDISVAGFGPGMGITVRLGSRRSIAQEGHLLMDLEAYLRERTGQPVELYMQPLADANKLRRKAADRLRAWEERRQVFKQVD